MFGPYEISLNGSVFHGNVSLKEHHFFERSGEYFLLRVSDMAAAPISSDLV